MKKFIITTTINSPTEAIIKFDNLNEWHLIVVGDKKTPIDYSLQNGLYISPKDQEEYFKDLCVVEALFGGSTRPCKWLEFNASDSSAWLKGTEKGDLVIPDVFKNQNKK